MGRAPIDVTLVLALGAVALGATGCAEPSRPEAAPINLVIGKSPPQDAAAPSASSEPIAQANPEESIDTVEDPFLQPEPSARLPPPTLTPGCPPFDRGAAAAALTSVDIKKCKRPGGPDGAGHLRITYAQNGHVQSVALDSGPFPGTPVGSCIALLYRNATIPAFCGSPVTVGKSFSLR